MNSYLYLWKIKRYLAWFTSHVRLENKSGNTDTSKFAETFIIPILNIVLNNEFKRLEFVKRNFPAIDLGTDDGTISFQITSEKGIEKIRNSITTYLENKLYEKFEVMYHLVIDETYMPQIKEGELDEFIKSELVRLKIKHKIQKFFTLKTNFWNVDLLRENIEKICTNDQLKKISDYFEKEYLPIQSLPTFDDILIPFQIAFKAQLDLTNKNLPYQFHTPFFGRESDMEKITEFLTNPKSSVFALIADGGYGKTRLTVELFNQIAGDAEKYEAFVINESAFQCLDFAEQLKTEKQVIILFDDAHNRPEILNDVIGVANRLQNVKLILTIRKAVYSDTIKVVATHQRAIETLELNRLSYSETQKLFKTQLGGLKDIEIKRLAEESKGIPFVILGLCQITLQGKYKSELSEEANFIHFVRELKEQVIADINSKYYIQKDKINKTIELLSFFAPVKNTPEELVEISKLNEVSEEETNMILEYLNEYEFINKQNEISIKPDPYSDTILLDSAQRIKYILQKDLTIFLDRLIRNLVEVEQSQRLNLSIDSLLFDFVTSFKNKIVESSEDIKILESNLDTLKSFTYKKPHICFLAINHLLSSQLDNDEFWKKEEDFEFFSKSFKNIHESIEIILSIVALNTHNISDFEKLYELLNTYQSKKQESRIFQKVFRFRVYDFYEYGYHPIIPCERQQFLFEKLDYLLEHEEHNDVLFNHILDYCKILLSLEFEGENHYDKYTHAYTYGRHQVIYNDTTKRIREDVIKILIKSYELIRFSPISEKYLEELIRTLFFMAKQRRNEYQFNQADEITVVVGFLQRILNDNPNMFERSSVIRQLKLFERREIKAEYIKVSQELLDLSEKVDTPKEKLNLLFLDEYFSIRNNIGNIFRDIVNQYNDWNLLYSDLLEVKASLSQKDYTTLREILSQLITNYQAESKDLLDFVIKNSPEHVCDFTTLIRANYKDQEYFYSIIEQIWNLDYECVKGSVLWMLTYGRNQEVNLYRDDDLSYVEYVIENKIIQAIWSISFSISKYILVNPERTIDLIARILKISENTRENDHLIHSLFDDKEILSKHPVLIKNFIFKETLEIPLDSYYFDSALNFLENSFGFDDLFIYLKEKLHLLDKKENYFSLSLHKHYSNPDKDQLQSELDFLKVILWYSELENKSEYLHKKLVEYLRPMQIQSEEFKKEFIQLIKDAGNNEDKVIDLCNALDVYENKSEYLMSILIEISNELCDKFKLSNEKLIMIFGSNFIHNLGMKSGPAGGPFPQDLNKRDELIQLMDKYKMHPKVKEVFMYSLEKVNKDIERDKLLDYDERW
jgi:hypothetical protein